jgi:hypothetical protein
MCCERTEVSSVVTDGRLLKIRLERLEMMGGFLELRIMRSEGDARGSREIYLRFGLF